MLKIYFHIQKRLSIIMCTWGDIIHFCYLLISKPEVGTLLQHWVFSINGNSPPPLFIDYYTFLIPLAFPFSYDRTQESRNCKQTRVAFKLCTILCFLRLFTELEIVTGCRPEQCMCTLYAYSKRLRKFSLGLCRMKRFIGTWGM